MRRRWNTLRRGMLAVLCSIAMICSGLMPMAVQADEVDPYTFGVYVGEAMLPDEMGNTTATVGGGTATLNMQTHTLTLRNVTIDINGYAGIEAGNGDLTIVLEGTNKITSDQAGIYVRPGVDQYGNWHNYSLTITGSGSLEITSGSEYLSYDNGSGLYAVGDVTIRDGANVSINSAYCGIETEGNVTIENARVKATGGEQGDKGSGISAGGNVTIKRANVSAESGLLWAGFENRWSSNGIAADGLTITDRSTVNAIGSGRAICSTDHVRIVDSYVNAEGRYEYNGEMVYEGNSLGIYGEQDGRTPRVEISGASDLTLIGPCWLQEFGGLSVSPSANGTAEITGSYNRDGSDPMGYYYTDEDGNRVESPFDSKVSLSADELMQVRYLRFLDSEAYTTPSTEETSDEHGRHHHVYEWETYKAATATTDGVMRYRCKTCGTVEYEVPTAAYYVFNKDAQESIKNAAAGATVTVSTPIFISFHEMVKDALVERPDVTLVVDYKNQGKSYEMTIPAGSGATLETLFGDSQFAGFLYLGGAFQTVEQ